MAPPSRDCNTADQVVRCTCGRQVRRPAAQRGTARLAPPACPGRDSDPRADAAEKLPGTAPDLQGSGLFDRWDLSVDTCASEVLQFPVPIRRSTCRNTTAREAMTRGQIAV